MSCSSQGPVALDAARAAVNRARFLPQVVYANLDDPGGYTTHPAEAQAVLAQQPPVSRMIVKFRDPRSRRRRATSRRPVVNRL